MFGRFPFLRVTCKFTFQNNFFLSNGVSYCVPKNCFSTDKWLRIFTNTVFKSWYYWQKKIKLMLEQYLKLNQRFESISYHCIMLWSSLVRIICADKFGGSKKYNFYNFHLYDQNHWRLQVVLDNKYWLLLEKLLLSLLAHFYHKIIDSFLYTNKLSTFANSWGQFQMLEKILNFFLFGKISKT